MVVSYLTKNYSPLIHYLLAHPPPVYTPWKNYKVSNTAQSYLNNTPSVPSPRKSLTTKTTTLVNPNQSQKSITLSFNFTTMKQRTV